MPPPSALICKFIFILSTAEPLLGFDCIMYFDINFNMQRFEFKLIVDGIFLLIVLI